MAIENGDWRAAPQILSPLACLFPAFFAGVIFNMFIEWATVRRILVFQNLVEEAQEVKDYEKVDIYRKKIRRLRKAILGKVKELGE